MKQTINMTSEKMKTVKSSCDNAPFGEKKVAAMKHYRAAETAHAAKDHMKTNKELDAAKHALA